MNPAIYYHPEAYSITGPKLMGRNAAGESFLRGYALHSSASEFWVQVEHADHVEQFEASIRAAGRNEQIRVVQKTNLQALSHAGVIYHPGPGIGESALRRSIFDHQAWSLCGVTHTTSSAAAMDAIVDLVTAPVQPWDALICTSHSVKANVTQIIDAQLEYMRDRLGITKTVLPQLPVIPLGIHAQDFQFPAASKQVSRTALGIDADSIVVLYMGRLSFHAKAHPMAMYQSLEIAANETGKKLVLIECGWHANDHIHNAFAEAAKITCPSVRVICLDGRVADQRNLAWQSADIFCSLSDNIQETFGITPIEAMAAGLPVVVSDWDGYKDSVRDGVDGFRVPTTMPLAGLGNDLAARHALGIDTYDMYCGHTSSLISVEVKSAAKAFIALINDANLRASMGESSQKRVKDVYDWEKIIPRYERLWAELTEIRVSSGPGATKKKSQRWPARMDPFLSFAGYTTTYLEPTTILRLSGLDLIQAQSRINAFKALAMVNYAKEIAPTDNELMIVISNASDGPLPARDLVRGITDQRRHHVFRALSWLLKLNILEAI